MDAITNFGKVTVSTLYDNVATNIVLSTGHGATLPDPATDGEFNLVWWDITTCPDPADDPKVEIVRCTARTGDTLTVTRAQEGTTATTKSRSSCTYIMILAATKKTFDDISSEIDGDISTHATDTDAHHSETHTIASHDTTVTGAELNALKTKADGIEENATADQTGSEIKTAYEAEANTNAYTDAEKTKLSGIETGATADQTKTDIDALGINATTVGGYGEAALAKTTDLSDYILLTQKAAVNGVATLDGTGLIPTNQLPALAITDTFECANEAAMLACGAEKGDVAIRDDLNKTYILSAEPASTLGNWKLLKTPTDAVISVDGRTGAVTLSDLYATLGHDHDSTYLGIAAKAADSELLDGVDSTNYARTDVEETFDSSVGVGGAVPAGDFDNGKALALGDSDTGIRQDGDGTFEHWCNNVQVSQFTSVQLDLYKKLMMNAGGEVVGHFGIGMTPSAPLCVALSSGIAFKDNDNHTIGGDGSGKFVFKSLWDNGTGFSFHAGSGAGISEKFRMDGDGSFHTNTIEELILDNGVDIEAVNLKNGLVDGWDVGAMGTKVDAIETGATADQTGAEIKTAYEAEANTNAFTDAEKTKLGNIEDSATADQSGSEIKIAYEAEANTNAYTDTEKTKLAGIADSANNYSLPTAAADTLGGVKVGSGLEITAGVLSATGGGGGDPPRMERKVEGQLITTVLKLGVLHQADTITAARAIVLDSLPVGQSVKVDIRKNGTDVTDSIFTSDVPIEILTNHTATNDVYIGTGTLDSGRTSCSQNDVFYVVVTQVGSTYAGSGLLVQLIF